MTIDFSPPQKPVGTSLVSRVVAVSTKIVDSGQVKIVGWEPACERRRIKPPGCYHVREWRIATDHPEGGYAVGPWFQLYPNEIARS